MKRRIHVPTLGAAGGLALVLLASPATAQVDLGRIDLTVEDTTGAVLPGAAVAITGPEDRSNIFTDVQGEGHLLRLPVGTYKVSVTLPGFRVYIDTAVQVRAASSARLVATLEVGGIDETVTVSGTAPIIRPAPPEHRHARDGGRVAGDPFRARPVGGAADHPRRRRRPRQRRRGRIGPAVDLHGEGRAQATRTPGRSTAS